MYEPGNKKIKYIITYDIHISQYPGRSNNLINQLLKVELLTYSSVYRADFAYNHKDTQEIYKIERK